MPEKAPVLLVIQTRIKPSKYNQFKKWGEKLTAEIEKFPGYLSQSISEPHPPTQLDWIIIQKFSSINAAKSWLQSDQRQVLLKEIVSYLIGIDHVYLVEEKKQDQESVTATISNKIHPQDEEKFLAWQAQIAPLQSKFPGFLGYKLEKPRPGIQENWITIITFDTEKHLDAWLDSAERKKMVAELEKFSSTSNIQKVHSGFDFWFTQQTRSPWRENMLVLLTLYPVVFLLSFPQKLVMSLGVPFWLALFFGNATSTAILGWFTTPLLMRLFNWWLYPAKSWEKFYMLLGALIVCALYALSLFLTRFISSVTG